MQRADAKFERDVQMPNVEAAVQMQRMTTNAADGHENATTATQKIRRNAETQITISMTTAPLSMQQAAATGNQE